MTPDSAEGVKIIRRLIEAEESGEFEPAQVFLGPYTAFMTVSALQLAWRHPELAPALKKVIESIGRDIQGMFAGPAGKLLDRGWDLSQDTEWERP